MAIENVHVMFEQLVREPLVLNPMSRWKGGGGGNNEQWLEVGLHNVVRESLFTR